MYDNPYDRDQRAWTNRSEGRRDQGSYARQSRGGMGRDHHEGRSWEGGRRYGRTDNDRFHNEDEYRRVPRNETDRLIASDKVEGTPVYDRSGDKIGKIDNFMVGKRSGRVEYAVLSFGGFMGMGDNRAPIDWDQLTYDERCDGYVLDISERELDRYRD